MSAQAEKVLRRDLRRAMGEQAIGVIDHNARVIAQLQRGLNVLNVRVERAVQPTYNVATDELFSQPIRDIENDVAELKLDRDAAYRFMRVQTFWQRLRWLVTGQ